MDTCPLGHLGAVVIGNAVGDVLGTVTMVGVPVVTATVGTTVIVTPADAAFADVQLCCGDPSEEGFIVVGTVPSDELVGAAVEIAAEVPSPDGTPVCVVVASVD